MSLERDCGWFYAFEGLNFIFWSWFVVDSYCNNNCCHCCLIVKIIVEIIYEVVKFSKPRVMIVVYFDMAALQKKHLKSLQHRRKLSIEVVCCCVML